LQSHYRYGKIGRMVIKAILVVVIFANGDFKEALPIPLPVADCDGALETMEEQLPEVFVQEGLTYQYFCHPIDPRSFDDEPKSPEYEQQRQPS
jgi:hypothetical protein